MGLLYNLVEKGSVKLLTYLLKKNLQEILGITKKIHMATTPANLEIDIKRLTEHVDNRVILIGSLRRMADQATVNSIVALHNKELQ